MIKHDVDSKYLKENSDWGGEKGGTDSREGVNIRGTGCQRGGERSNGKPCLVNSQYINIRKVSTDFSHLHRQQYKCQY